MTTMYMLYILITAPNGGQQVIPSNPYVFTLKACHSMAAKTKAQVLKEMPDLMVTHKCKPVSVQPS